MHLFTCLPLPGSVPPGRRFVGGGPERGRLREVVAGGVDHHGRMLVVLHVETGVLVGVELAVRNEQGLRLLRRRLDGLLLELGVLLLRRRDHYRRRRFALFIRI